MTEAGRRIHIIISPRLFLQNIYYSILWPCRRHMQFWFFLTILSVLRQSTTSDYLFEIFSAFFVFLVDWGEMELIIWQYDVKNIYEICNNARDLEYTNVVLLIKTNVNRVKIIYIFLLSMIDYHDYKLKYHNCYWTLSLRRWMTFISCQSCQDEMAFLGNIFLQFVI